MSVGYEFVEGWHVVQVLGEGAFGEVKLLICDDGEAVAMKTIEMDLFPDAENAVKKEMLLHRMTNHENVIKFFGGRWDGVENKQYMFIEYASGGELFDRITPDIGMPLDQARIIFGQLIDGMEHLHNIGIAHRDIKPENLLLDGKDVLKISDFGMATLFRYQGKERKLEKRCGTKPYIAPEVMLHPYSAPPADIWSCGVVLVVTLCGVHPWDEPSVESKRFQMWREKSPECLNMKPWKNMDNLTFAFVKKILSIAPQSRYTISQMRKCPWFTSGPTEIERTDSVKRTHDQIKSESDVTPMSKKPFIPTSSASEFSMAEPVPEFTRLASSQPDPQFPTENIPNAAQPFISFSQPANPEHLLVSSQISQGVKSSIAVNSSNQLQRLVKRMTRVLVEADMASTLAQLQDIFSNLNYSYKRQLQNLITVRTTDKRGTLLVFKVTVLDMGNHMLVDFRLSKGCGLDFKRHFLDLKDKLSNVIAQGPVTWTMAMGTNMLPT